MVLSGTDLRRTSASTLVAKTPSKSLSVTITTHSNQTATASEWTQQLFERHSGGGDSGDGVGGGGSSGGGDDGEQWRDHRSWWRNFWNRSHIWVGKTNDDLSASPSPADLALLTQQYAITRYGTGTV